MGIFDDVSGFAADKGITFGSLTALGGYLLGIIILAIIGGAIIYFVVMKKHWNKKIVILQKVNGIVQVVGYDVASEQVIAPGGLTAFFLKNRKLWRARPTIMTGADTFWFFIDSDGNWINTGIEDFDDTTKLLSLKQDPIDLRNSRAALQKLLKDNYKKEKWWERYAPYIALTILILILGIAAWMIADKLVEAVSIASQNMATQKELAELQKEILGALDNICSTSGLKPGG